MKVTFTDVCWRNEQDSSEFNVHAIKSIELEGLKNGIITIYGTANTFKAPYCKLHFPTGIDRYELTTKHPFEHGVYINIAIFNGRVAVIAECAACVPEWFKYKCKTYIPSF